MSSRPRCGEVYLVSIGMELGRLFVLISQGWKRPPITRRRVLACRRALSSTRHLSCIALFPSFIATSFALPILLSILSLAAACEREEQTRWSNPEPSSRCSSPSCC